MNVDVAFDMDSGFGATGVIIHDGHGTSLVEANIFFNYVVLMLQW